MMLLATALALGTTACTLNFGSGREDGDSGADTQTETTVFAEYTLYAPSSIAVTFLIDKEGEVISIFFVSSRA